jgi:hypothetical protein
MSFVGSASALDLITNGSFESAIGPEWKYYATYKHATQNYATGVTIPETENPGANYTWRHGSANGSWNNFVTPTNLTDHLQYNLQWGNSQTVALTNALTGAAVDAGLGRFSFSAWLASYGTPSSNPEQPFLVLRFFNASTNIVGSEVIFDRTTNTHAVVFADGNTFIPDDLTFDHSWIKYAANGTVPANARWATVYITRSPNAPLTSNPDTYVDLVKLDVINVNDTTVLDGAVPANNQANVSPDTVLTVNLKDVNTQVNPATIAMTLNGTAVTPLAIQKSGAVTTVAYDPPGLLPPFVTNTYTIRWSDNAASPTWKTNSFAFTVSPYVNVELGPPIHQETFDSLAEGTLPAGWSVQNFTDQDLPWPDLNDFRSDSYLDWVVISRNTLMNLMNVVPGGEDFVATTNVAPNQVINGTIVTNLINNNFIFAVADRGANGGQKQIQYLFTRDYNLAGRANVYLVFNNIYVQNQDSMGSVEYSIDGGTTWLPARYYLEAGDILRNPDGSINASNTFAARYADVADVETGTLTDGNYGQYIGVKSNQWSTLAPYLAQRIDDDQTSSKTVEIIRLTQADNQAAVRLRFAQVGQYSWYFGIDDLGFYSLTAVAPPVLASGPTPATQVAAAGNAATLTIATALGLGPVTYQWRHEGTNLPGQTSQTLGFAAVQPANAGIYDVVASNGGGSVTSAPAMLTVINPVVFVTGQWDFQGNLAATYGRDLESYDATVQADTTFGTTTSFGLPGINGQTTSIMRFVPSANAWGGYRMYHGAGPNGGGSYVNQYTLVYDVYYPASSSGWRSLLQTGTGNGNDGDFFINPTGGIGISSVYNGFVAPDQWNRIAFAFDLTGPGQAPVLTKFINGVKVGNQTSGLSGRDGRFALDAHALLFADQDGDVAEAYVSSVQFSNGRRPDAFITALGGPSAAKIPGAIKVQVTGGNSSIVWTGGVPLESAPGITGPWTIVNGATSPYPVPAGTAARFYRPKLP